MLPRTDAIPPGPEPDPAFVNHVRLLVIEHICRETSGGHSGWYAMPENEKWRWRRAVRQALRELAGASD